MTNFNFQPTLIGESVSIRPLDKIDFDALYRCASDKKLWEGHPAKDRYKKAEFTKWFESAIESAATILVIDNVTDEIIGSSRFYVLDSEPQDISIGYTFISRQYWGGKTNHELKKLMLSHAFRYVNTAWFHIARSNIRSQKAIEKIGGVYSHDESAHITGKSEPRMCYKIERKNWLI